MESEASLIDFAPVFTQLIPQAELDRLAAEKDQLPEDYGVRVAVITTRPELSPLEKYLLLTFARLTHYHNEESQLDSKIHDERLKEQSDQLKDQEEMLKKSALRHVFFVITFGLINGGNWPSLIELAFKDSKDDARHQEDGYYVQARRRANTFYISHEQDLFESGKTILSDSGKALFNRLGDRRETRPRYKLPTPR